MLYLKKLMIIQQIFLSAITNKGPYSLVESFVTIYNYFLEMKTLLMIYLPTYLLQRFTFCLFTK